MHTFASNKEDYNYFKNRKRNMIFHTESIKKCASKFCDTSNPPLKAVILPYKINIYLTPFFFLFLRRI